MIMASMLAMALLVASPAMAQDGGDAADDSIGGAGGDVSNTQYNTEICQNIVGDIDVNNENTAAQYGGDDTGINAAEGDGNAQLLSQDEAFAIAQENNTTVNIVQQCFQQSQQAQGEDIDQAQAGAQSGVIGDANGDGVADDGVVDGGDAVDEADTNGDGVVDEDEAGSIADAETADAVAAADTNGDGVVDAAEAEAVASAGDADAAASAGDADAAASAGDADAAASAGDAEAAASTGDAEAAAGEDEAVAVLPDTGGASLFTLGAGALLVAGGLLARRIVR